jgi:hypothetical protein
MAFWLALSPFPVPAPFFRHFVPGTPIGFRGPGALEFRGPLLKRTPEMCSCPTSHCRYGAVLSLHGPASLLLWLRLLGAWVLGCQGWITTWRAGELSGLCKETRATPGTETYTTTLGNSQDRSWSVPYSGRCLGPKSATIWGNSRDRCAGKKDSLCENLYFLSHICKSSLRALIHRDVVSVTHVTPDRIFVFAVIGW